MNINIDTVDETTKICRQIEACINEGAVFDAQALLDHAYAQGIKAELLSPYRETLTRLLADLTVITDLFATTNYQSFESRANRWAERFPKDPLIWKLIGASLLEQGKFEASIAPLWRAVELAPYDYEALVNYANAQWKLDEPQIAIAAYSAACQQSIEALALVLSFARHLDSTQQCHSAIHLLTQLKVFVAPNFDLQMLLGALEFKAGLWNDAQQSYREADQVQPGNLNSLSNLAACYLKLGNLTEAEAWCEKALRLNDQDPLALNNYGAIMLEKGNLSFAELALQRAIQIKPDYAVAHRNLGATYKEQRKFDVAEGILRKAIALDPSDAEAIAYLGDVVDREHGVEHAKKEYEKALALDPNCTAALTGMGFLLITIGKFSEAEFFFNKAKQIKADLPNAWAGIALTRKMRSDDNEWFDNATKILEQSPPSLVKAALCFSMGKAYNDVKNYDQAFALYEQANQLSRKDAPQYDPVAESELISSLIKKYSHKEILRFSTHGSVSKRPVFVVGMPRSGTSLIEQIIASHPRAFGAGELSFWSNESKALEPYAEGVLDTTKVQSLAETYLQKLMRLSPDADRVVDKMPGNFFHVGLIHSVFPMAKIIHARRNPIDTCLSIYFQNFNPGHTYAKDLADLAHYYREYFRLMQHWRQLLPKETLFELQYESLVEDSGTWSKALIDFIDLEWDERCLQFQETERKVGTASNWQVRQKIYTSSRERWRKYEAHLAPLLPLLDLCDE